MKINKYKLILGAFSLAFLTACDFEAINTDDFGMTPEQGKMDGIVVGGPITSMQRCVTSVGTVADDTDVINQYQVAYHLSADCWSGYFAQNGTWDNGNCNVNYYLKENWVSASFTESYTNILPLWKEVKQESEKSDMPEAFALAQILKISAWHKTTDMFGPIPYKNAGEMMLVIPYDSQEDVYKYFFEDLTAAIEVLTPKAEQGGKLLSKFDVVYAGDVRKWVKYANSLMLRLAMRIRYADATTAQKYAEQAVNHPIGVMESKDDEAKMGSGAGLVFVNNIETLANQYNESRMGSSMFAYLAGYQDPRLKAYFKEAATEDAVQVGTLGKYRAVPTGHAISKNESAGFFLYSLPNIEKTTPTYWMRASEVYFLRAEGALLNWNMKGSVEDLYRQGIETSFVENNVAASEVVSYMNSGRQPASYTNSRPSVNESAPTLATAAWDATSDEQRLEKIMIQKWIALYPNGQEAWSEWRRTGYPKLHKVVSNYGRSQGVTDVKLGIRRMIYPANRSTSEADKANLQKAIEMLGPGGDASTTNLWWDKKVH